MNDALIVNKIDITVVPEGNETKPPELVGNIGKDPDNSDESLTGKRSTADSSYHWGVWAALENDPFVGAMNSTSMRMCISSFFFLPFPVRGLS